MTDDGIEQPSTGLLSDAEVGEKFGCAAGPDAPCGHFLACARLKEAIANGFNMESGAAQERTAEQQLPAPSANGNME